MTVRFDESLPILVTAVVDSLGAAAVASGVVLRDATGRLSFVSKEPIADQPLRNLSDQLRMKLGPYARTDRQVASGDDPGVADILEDQALLFLKVGDHTIRLLDRRLVGGDWLRAPAAPAPPPPRFVFASLKGGVGRSTALSVAAADLAAKGRRVLAVDLDMEAPGLGAMLLEAGDLPEFGLVDALVENGISKLDNEFFADLVAPSPLADRRGRIDVLPAFGRRSLLNPGEILAKVSRAYMEDLREDGSVASILDQISALIDHFSSASNYDAILIDSRAGLHETTASAILGLGAEVFFFGLDEPQTFQGAAALFAHLSHFLRVEDPVPEWVERLTMVQGRARSLESHEAFSEKCRTLFSQTLMAPFVRKAEMNESGEATVPLPAEPFGNVPWDDSISDEALGIDEGASFRDTFPILEDERFRLFQPTVRRDLLSEAVYQSPYKMLLTRVGESFPPIGGKKT